ncbi:MAG: A/G-specific adenine glycosylase [Acidobacteria bacterium]|nr:A/G-specific adenine glycosylase [Acidobacteriota bacterium]
MIDLAVDPVLLWASGRREDLPWRRTRDPWAVLVSESMLQQTQVARVVPRYRRFLERFPTVAACAEAGVGAVVAEWAGLGYNRRAVNLHRSAVVVVEEHDGVFPDELASLLALPGVGPYTARAVLAFAFERDAAVVDTNVGRVLARQMGQRLTPALAQRVADSLVPEDRSWAWNQAMLDLGALICTKRSPTCDRCPARSSCAWVAAGSPSPDPAIGSAGVSAGQSRFEGSFRQGRARLLDHLRSGVALMPADLTTACGWTDRVDGDAEARRAAASLVRDGLAVTGADGSLRLP